jgi:hypothetical protein
MPPPGTVRATTQELLADPQFRPDMTFAQWLEAQLEGLRAPEIESLGWGGQLVLWAVGIWCVLTLLAILGHFVWTFWSLKSRKPKSASGRPQHELQRVNPEVFAQELVAQGKHLEAAGALMQAALLCLEEAGLLRRDEAKTNGEYLKELSRGRPVRASFARFVQRFDALAYSGNACGPGDVSELSERLREMRTQLGPR